MAAIVGGKRARKGEFPWQVGLVPTGSRKPFCGGSVISDFWILTAAHCTDGASASDFQVMLGAHNWKRNKPKAQIVNVKRIIEHPNYDKFTGACFIQDS